MFCSKCGKENPDQAAFCSTCGAPISQPAAQQAAPAPAPAAPYTPPAAPVAPGATITEEGQIYPMEEKDRTLRLINFILCVITCVLVCWAIVPLAWCIPMTVHSWGIYKGTKPNTTAFGVCTLIFVDIIGGILLLVSRKDK